MHVWVFGWDLRRENFPLPLRACPDNCPLIIFLPPRWIWNHTTRGQISALSLAVCPWATPLPSLGLIPLCNGVSDNNSLIRMSQG